MAIKINTKQTLDDTSVTASHEQMSDAHDDDTGIFASGILAGFREGNLPSSSSKVRLTREICVCCLYLSSSKHFLRILSYTLFFLSFYVY
jgi:hypothetical protein